MPPTPQNSMRTFRGPDSRTVLSAVKAALGSEAVILSSREFPGSLFRPAAIEVTAALVDPTPPSVAAQAIADRYAEQPPRRSAPEFDRELEALRACVSETQNALSLVTRQARLGQDLQLAPAAAQFHTHLCMQGFDAALAEELVRELSLGGVPRTAAGFRDPARKTLGRLLHATPPPWEPLRDKRRRVIALVGPTGVGKTTTLAKIAARALLESRQKVCLITLDTYRIGAAEQIAHYGNLMDLPTFVARDGAEICAALGRCPEAALVLIDTAGRSRMEEVVRQAELVRAVPGIELQLVLSATTSAGDLAGLARRYRSLLPTAVIVTKVDETATPGGLLSALAVAQRPVSCLTNGQRVPEDIQAVGDDDLVDLILGESRWTMGRN